MADKVTKNEDGTLSITPEAIPTITPPAQIKKADDYIVEQNNRKKQFVRQIAGLQKEIDDIDASLASAQSAGVDVQAIITAKENAPRVNP